MSRSRTAAPPSELFDALNRPGMPLTRSQLRTLAETVYHGSMPAAAECMGISAQTGKNHLLGVRRRLVVHSTLHALLALGWLTIPADDPVVGTLHHSVTSDLP
jgi:DNA-binding CsgD family transcriptional regulator